ncbi:tetratricopeptide repeat protein [Gloeothece verrucosa]|uniref:TPR repeat-containing protein n=1 Tax=Gloeothece verrucosa (strain PCC 7822) TaxID=497965 RepID=E0U8A3_GLOV7|nr:tetratricopeptide repeat protein [Gloeothece verrucosa]ADN12539.1 TPR repeat-containing protein [Gloeothece verrucosa PCC 7822]
MKSEKSALLSVKPIISYPREAQAGKTYLMTIDLEVEEGFEWQYEEEEYPIFCQVDSDFFKVKSVDESVLVLHRFGGSYGEVRFLLTAGQKEAKGRIRVILINKWGVPVKVFYLEDVQITTKEEIRSVIEIESRKPINLTSQEEAYQPAIASKLSDVNQKFITELVSRNFFAYDEAWVGRESLVQELCNRLRESCRLLLLVGMTGIGKTALGEKLALDLEDWFKGDWSKYYQVNFDNEEKSSDFASVAAQCLEKWGELITPDARNDTHRLLYRLLKHLQENRYLIQIDSLENILQGNEEEGWSDFKDEWWVKFFTAFLNSDSCFSCIIITSQDLPRQIVEIGSRFTNFWYCQALSGLKEQERLALFEKIGVDISPESVSRPYLERIGIAYEGNPLALRVIAGEIKNQPFNGNVIAYWNKYGSEIEEVEKLLAEAQTGKTIGEDSFKLDRFTKTLRRNVRSRFNKTFARLKEDATYAYILLCEASVYRCPVPEEFWLSHLEDWDRDEDEQLAALDILRDRYLVEELVDNDRWLLRQHNLIRSIALEHLKQLDSDEEKIEIDSIELNSLPTQSDVEKAILSEIRATLLSNPNITHLQRINYRAVVNWLTHYKPIENSSRIEQVKGYLEAFYHLCEVEAWEAAYKILSLQIDTPTEEELLEQLGTWGYYQVQVEICTILLQHLSQSIDIKLYNCLGNANYIFGKYSAAIEIFHQSLNIAHKINDRKNESIALVYLGLTYNSLGQYQQAIELYHQALAISKNIRDIRGESHILGNLGLTYHYLGQYQHAISYHLQYLRIAREIGDRRGEGTALGNLGNAYCGLQDYQLAINLYRQYLMIAKEIDDRRGVGIALGNLGNAYLDSREYEQAIYYLEEALVILREINDRQGEGFVLGHLGNTQIKLEQYDEALENLQTSLTIFQEIDSRAGVSESLKNLAELHHKINQPQQAQKYYEQALQIATDLGIPLVQEIQDSMKSLTQENESS